MKSNEIRKQFLDYFAGKGHTVVASSPLVHGFCRPLVVGHPEILWRAVRLVGSPE